MKCTCIKIKKEKIRASTVRAQGIYPAPDTHQYAPYQDIENTKLILTKVEYKDIKCLLTIIYRTY